MRTPARSSPRPRAAGRGSRGRRRRRRRHTRWARRRPFGPAPQAWPPAPPRPPPPDRLVAAGSWKRKVTPRSAFASTAIVPRCACTIERQTASPSPRPSRRVVQNGSKTASRCSAAIPTPASRTATTTRPSSVRETDTRRPPLVPRARLHRRGGVQDQVERDLLDLHLVRHGPAVRSELGLDADPLPAELGGEQLEDLAQRRGDVDPRAARFVVPQQGAHRPDRVRRPLVVAHDRLEDGAHLLRSDRATLEIAQPRLRVAEDRGERLVQLVRDRGGERGGARDAVGVPEAAAQLLRLVLEPRPGEWRSRTSRQ